MTVALAQVSALSVRSARSATKQTTDEALVASIAAGNRLAMQLLYARHNVRVYRFVLGMLHNDAAAEDVVSETFFDVWQQAGRFEGRSKLSTWLMSIARHKALTTLRSRQHEQIDDHAETMADQADTPEAAMQKTDKSAMLQAALAQLTPAHREIINLVYHQERKIEDVAEILGIPLNTVKTRMHYARKRLADLLARAGFAQAA
jgi:RNA polymerase sigma-70 factor (ECF subfamily)